MKTWKRYTFGRYRKGDIQEVVKDPEWQKVREGLKGKSLEEKQLGLQSWMHRKRYSRASRIQVTNYVNALKRAGLIPKKKRH
jgi:hypothetical protein